MSLFQFQSYLDNIPEIERLFRGKEEGEKVEEESDELLIARAKALGLKIPKKY